MHASAPAPFDPAADGWKLWPPYGFTALIGPFWTREDNGKRQFGFLAEARHDNRQGIVHGGMLMSFADSAIGMTAWEIAGRRPCVTMQMETQFLNAARGDDFVICEPELVRAAHSVIFMRGMLRTGDKPILAVSGIWKIIQKKA
ncbi:MAG: PaaI family thioesterase [Hyphomicrobiales bacterium]|nr:PaaI family thioesterase [Hyphomicrobiales bacterium]